MNLLEHEREYRSVINRIGATLLMFLLLSNVLGMFSLALAPLWASLLEPQWASLLTSAVDGIVYMLSYILPIGFFRLFSQGKRTEPIKLAPRLPRATPAYVFAGMAVILVASYLNFQLIAPTGYAEYTAENLWMDTYGTPQEVMMSFATMAIIPAFVEELLFRGLIQSNLRPFGSGCAIIGSAVLFGLMHQNVEQIFYATVAGLLLGYLYEITESIWCCILLHLCNNGTAVIQRAIQSRMHDTVAADRICSLIDGAIIGIGVLCLILLLVRGTKQRNDLSEGCFARPLSTDLGYAGYELTMRRKVGLFFSPLMITYFALCVSTMLTVFGMAMVVMHGG